MLFRSSAQGRVQLSADQRAKVESSVLKGRNVPRVSRVDFSLNVGIAVPSRVRLAAVPAVLIEIHPEWRGHQFFVVEDEIIIVDRSRRIVAIVPVGGGSFARSTGGSSAEFVAIEALPREEIIIIQEALEIGRAHV